MTAGFLWLPVSRTSPAVKLYFLSREGKFREIDIALNLDHPEHYAAMDLMKYTGSRIEIRGNLPDSSAAYRYQSLPSAKPKALPEVSDMPLWMSPAGKRV